MGAVTELAGIIYNDAAAPVPNITDNIDHNEQLADNIDYNEQPIDAAVVHNIGNKAINNDPQYVVVEETNDAAAPVGNITECIDNNKQLRNVALNIDCHDVADGNLFDAVVGNGNNETHYAAIHNVGNTLTAPTIKYLNDELELRDRRMCDLEATIVDLESKMTALSDTVGYFSRCTLPDSRFSYKSEFSLVEGLNFVGCGEGKGEEDTGDDEDKESGNGDQKQNAYKRNVLQNLMMSIKGRWKSPNKLPTTRQDVLRLHIIKSFPLQKEPTDLLPEQTQDSSTQMASAILMPSSNALQVVLILLISCGVHQMKSIPLSVVEWVILIPASLLIFTKNVMKISTQMKVNDITTALNNEYTCSPRSKSLSLNIE